MIGSADGGGGGGAGGVTNQDREYAIMIVNALGRGMQAEPFRFNNSICLERLAVMLESVAAALRRWDESDKESGVHV